MDNGRLYQAERTARSEAERANRVKSEFLATMSHELRTPLNAMLGYTDLLLAGVPEPVSDSTKQKVERIEVNARHLLELIEEILTFSRLEAGKERLEIEEVHPEDVVREVQALMEPLAIGKGLAFVCETPPETPLIRTDPRKLRQILINLAGNAIKFTDHGEVRLRLESTGDELCFSVQDTGAGIAPEHLERIFEPFWQVQGGSTRTAGGTGLGLSVSRHLARLMGGELTVQSRPGEGATFSALLPLGSPAPANRPG
jgi:signal transduction histidine kinase